MITREASLEDWNNLEIFFKSVYRENHPLLQKEFWNWQFGYKTFGRSFICINDNGEIVGHVGATFGGGLAWIINVYLAQEFRGGGVLRQLYNLARQYFPLAATAANEAGLGLYNNMRWFRYHNLVRYVKINPNIKDLSFASVCIGVSVSINDLRITDNHYFQQPSIDGIMLEDGSRAISQENVGGLRVVDIVDSVKLEKHAWEIGYLWIDYITSWNDLKTKQLEKSGWVLDFKSIVPWRLNPIQENYFCDITFLSEEPLDRDFVVHRSYSDHGRIGSL
jgi:hypothetical protein